MPLFTLPGSWADADRIETYATNRTGSATVVGEIVSFDLMGSDGSVDVHSTDALDPFANVITPVAAHLVGWLFGICLEVVADDAQVKVLVRGVGDALLTASTNNETGDLLMPIAGTTLSKVTDGKAAIAISLDDGSTTSTAAVGSVYFDGKSSLGGSGAAAV